MALLTLTPSQLATSLRAALEAEPSLAFLACAEYISLQPRFDLDGMEAVSFHLPDSLWVEDEEGCCEPDSTLDSALRPLGYDPALVAAAHRAGCEHELALSEDPGMICLRDVAVTERSPLCQRLWEICAEHLHAAVQAELLVEATCEIDLGATGS